MDSDQGDILALNVEEPLKSRISGMNQSTLYLLRTCPQEISRPGGKKNLTALRCLQIGHKLDHSCQ